MSKCCCKYAKWFPHNWLCLKGLSIVFLVLFYAMLGLIIYQAVAIMIMFPAPQKWALLQRYTLSTLPILLGLWTVARILIVLRKIAKAVIPCCCEQKEVACEEKKEEVATEEQKEEVKEEEKAN